jgi:hypothetical protein
MSRLEEVLAGIPDAPPRGPKPVAAKRPARRRAIPDASRQRRRQLASDGRLTPRVRAAHTESERAALRIIAGECIRNGSCTLPIAAIAAKAGCGRTSVQNALRAANNKFINVKERPMANGRNKTHVITIIDPEWLAWLHLGEGSKLRQYPLSNLPSKKMNTNKTSLNTTSAAALGTAVEKDDLGPIFPPASGRRDRRR